jgi:hypothetical protein
VGLERRKGFFENVARYLDNHVAIDRLLDSSDRIAVIGRTYGTGLAVRLEIVLDVPAMQAALAL